MRGRNHSGVPARLLRLEKRFVAWRKTRKHGERIPPTLWRSAAKSTETHYYMYLAQLLDELAIFLTSGEMQLEKCNEYPVSDPEDTRT